MFSRILVPCDVSYDSSEWLNAAILSAWDLAEKYRSHVTFLAVVPEKLLKGFYPDVYEARVAQDALRKLQKIVERLIPEPSRTTCLVREGGICPEIIKAAKELSVDLVAMASHGPMGSDYLLGSNASHVALHAPCSVLILRPEGSVFGSGEARPEEAHRVS